MSFIFLKTILNQSEKRNMSDLVVHSAKASAAGFCRTERRKFESPYLLYYFRFTLHWVKSLFFAVLVFLTDQ